jgi:hypothetical protein
LCACSESHHEGTVCTIVSRQRTTTTHRLGTSYHRRYRHHSILPTASLHDDDGIVCTSVRRQRTTTTHRLAMSLHCYHRKPPPLTITHRLAAIITRLSWPRNEHAAVTTAAAPPKLTRVIRLAVRPMKTSRGRPGRSLCRLSGSATSTRWLPTPRVSVASLLRCVRGCVGASRL